MGPRSIGSLEDPNGSEGIKDRWEFMGEVSSQICHEEKLVRSVFTGEFQTSLLVNYFKQILNEVDPQAAYIEDVDFRAVTDFTISYDDFSKLSTQAAEMYKTGRIRKTLFRVSDELQYGMARLFSSSTGVDDQYFGSSPTSWSPS